MLKSTGIVRKIDDLGRVVLPIELRRTLSIGEKDAVEIFTDGSQIVLRKYEPGCVLTGEISADLVEYKGKLVSRAAIQEMAEAAGMFTEQKQPIEAGR